MELDQIGRPQTDDPLDRASVAGTRTGQLDMLGRACGFLGRNTITGDGQATVDGQPAVVRCTCEISSDNRVVGELAINGEVEFMVAFIDG